MWRLLSTLAVDTFDWFAAECILQTLARRRQWLRCGFGEAAPTGGATRPPGQTRGDSPQTPVPID